MFKLHVDTHDADQDINFDYNLSSQNVSWCFDTFHSYTGIDLKYVSEYIQLTLHSNALQLEYIQRHLARQCINLQFRAYSLRLGDFFDDVKNFPIGDIIKVSKIIGATWYYKANERIIFHEMGC